MFGSAFCFGLTSIFVRLASAHGGMGGGQLTFLRFTVGFALLLGFLRLRPGSFRPVRFGLLAVRGGFGGLAALLYFLGLARISAGEATLLNNTFPIWSVLLSVTLFGERPTRHLAFALVLASAGVLLVLGGGHLPTRLGSGELFALASGLAGGVAVTAIRLLRPTDNTPTIFSAMSVGGLLVSAPFAVGGWSHPPVVWAAALACGVAAFFAQVAMTEAYGGLSVTEAALWQQLTPIAAFLWGLTLGETFTAMTLLGVLLGVAGIVYGSLWGHDRRSAGRVRAG